MLDMLIKRSDFCQMLVTKFKKKYHISKKTKNKQVSHFNMYCANYVLDEE